MKAWTATDAKHGAAHPIELADVAEPVPASNQAVVEVTAFSVNRGEFLGLTGAYGPGRTAGTVPGQDVAGRVVVAAADGSGPQAGERVVAHPDGGGWAERVAVATDLLTTLPDHVSDEIAASLPLAGITAIRLLRKAGDVTGRRVLVTGASGGVGHLLVELLVAAGAAVTAVAATADRGQRLAAFGAEFVTEIARDGEPFELILESVGGATFAAALARLAPGGTVIWFGQAGLEPISLDFFELIGSTPLALHHFPHWVSDRSDATDLAELVSAVAAGTLHPELGRVTDWAETPTALADLAARRIRGNAVLTVRR
ncbi:zinc-binding dehydrogenase [Nocardia stercoris]|uniref:Alcohol dehydrogenase n=1 Tax=Nocardia stercoris TaxID=2483361 RepID=A0A3M2LEX6_9NOCA|nr:zinc-binding dehydrogenase [Nocardia stercoris]RMI35123.1 alcohol dehydrogenase [Nocardia stercoris]